MTNRFDLDEVFRAFVYGIEERGPSARELQRALGLSSSSMASKRLRQLEAVGLIERVTGKAGPLSYPYRLTALGRERAERDPHTAYVRSAS